jgi:hypothetical protein
MNLAIGLDIDHDELTSEAANRYMTSENSESQLDWPPEEAQRSYRVELRAEGAETVVLARVRNVFPHHDTLTQYVSRLLQERGSEPLQGELVLVDDDTNSVLARRDLGRACADTKRSRRRSKRSDSE